MSEIAEKADYLLQYYQSNKLCIDTIPKYQIILVGSNPLPAYVAVHMLQPAEVVFLVGTKGQSHQIAQRIQEVVRDEGITSDVRTLELGSANSFLDIDELMNQLSKSIDLKVAGINYTGGTKMMAVHFYRKLYELGSLKKYPHYSTYVSSENNKLLFDGFDNAIDLLGNTKLSMGNMLKIHRVEFKKKVDNFIERFLSQDHIQFAKVVYDDLKRIYDQNKNENDNSKFDYQELIKDIVFPYDKNREKDKSHEHFELISGFLQRELNVRWIGLTQYIREMEPDLEVLRVKDVANLYLSSSGKPKGYFDKLTKLSNSSLELFKDFYDWWSAKWQEFYVYSVLNSPEAIQRIGINVVDGLPQSLNSVEVVFDDDKSVNPFELDHVFIRSHIPYIISCTTDPGELVKGKLFEVQSRSRILGGDHAKFAMISFINDKQHLEVTLKRRWDGYENYIVMGVDDFFDDNFAENLIQWAANS